VNEINRVIGSFYAYFDQIPQPQPTFVDAEFRVRNGVFQLVYEFSLFPDEIIADSYYRSSALTKYWLSSVKDSPFNITIDSDPETQEIFILFEELFKPQDAEEIGSRFILDDKGLLRQLKKNPRRRNPASSALGSIAMAGIAGFLIGKSK
jgi:hypothetical protein